MSSEVPTPENLQNPEFENVADEVAESVITSLYFGLYYTAPVGFDPIMHYTGDDENYMKPMIELNPAEKEVLISKTFGLLEFDQELVATDKGESEQVFKLSQYEAFLHVRTDNEGNIEDCYINYE